MITTTTTTITTTTTTATTTTLIILPMMLTKITIQTQKNITQTNSRGRKETNRVPRKALATKPLRLNQCALVVYRKLQTRLKPLQGQRHPAKMHR